MFFKFPRLSTCLFSFKTLRPRPGPGGGGPAPTPAAAPAAPAATFAAQLTAFCAEATRTRPPSHGVQHMTKSANAEKIFDALRAAGEHPSMMNDQTRRMVQARLSFTTLLTTSTSPTRRRAASRSCKSTSQPS